MAKTALFTFGNEAIRDRFIKLVKAQADQLSTDDTRENDSVFIKQVLDGMRLDPPIKLDSERSAALFIAGRKLTEGLLTDMRRRFDQEIASHSASVELRELREGEWITIQQRRLQRV
jgi:hypothetical protein